MRDLESRFWLVGRNGILVGVNRSLNEQDSELEGIDQTVQNGQL